MGKFDDYIEDALGGNVSESENVRVDCINCGKEDHMYVHSDTGLAYCFVCGYSANMLQIIMALEGLTKAQAFMKYARIISSAKAHEHRAYSGRTAQDMLLSLLKTHRDVGEATVYLPDGCISLDDRLAGAGSAYLRGRGFTRKHWAPYKLMYVASPSPKQEQRRFYRHIVFPIYVGGSLVYWTTRAAYDPPKGIPKSYNAEGAGAKTKLGAMYGFSEVRSKTSCIIVEGPLDVLSLPECSVGLLGKFMAQAQLDRLAARFKRVYVALDSDAVGDAVACYEALACAGVDPRICIFNEGDPADRVSVPRSKNGRDIVAAARVLSMAERIKYS